MTAPRTLLWPWTASMPYSRGILVASSAAASHRSVGATQSEGCSWVGMCRRRSAANQGTVFRRRGGVSGTAGRAGSSDRSSRRASSCEDLDAALTGAHGPLRTEGTAQSRPRQTERRERLRPRPPGAGSIVRKRGSGEDGPSRRGPPGSRPYQMNLKPNCICRGSRVRVAWPKLVGTSRWRSSRGRRVAGVKRPTTFIVVFIPANRKFVLLNKLKMSQRNCSLTVAQRGSSCRTRGRSGSSPGPCNRRVGGADRCRAGSRSACTRPG